MRPEAYNARPQKGGSVFVLFLLVIGMLLCSAWDYTGQPIVYYSQATGKPLFIETEKGKQVVTPSTILPEKYEKVWVP